MGRSAAALGRAHRRGADGARRRARVRAGQAAAARHRSVPAREIRSRDIPRDGRTRAARRDAARRIRRRRSQLRLLRVDRARDRARRLGLPVDDERAKLARHVSDLHVRLGGAAQEISAEARDRRVDRLLRTDRAEPRIGSRQHGDARPGGAGRLQALRREDVDFEFADRRRVRRLGEDRRRRDPRLHPRKGDEGIVDAEDRRQVQPAHVDHRRDRDGRRVRAGGEPAAERGGTEGTVRLPQCGALRHRLGRARRRGILLARGAPVHARPHAVRATARGQSARPEEARRHDDRDHARPAGLPAARADEGRGHRRAGDHVDHEAQFVRQGARHRARPRATCTAATASSTSFT